MPFGMLIKKLLEDRGNQMTTPEQITKWREEFETNHKPQMITRYVDGSYQLDYMEDMWTGYLRACTEQAGEIAELKAKLAEVMPLARFGAHMTSYVGGVCFARASQINEAAHRSGVILSNLAYAPNIEATITKLLTPDWVKPSSYPGLDLS